MHENSLLSLNSNVLGPFDESGKISLGLDVTSNSEVTGVLLEEGVLFAGTGSGGVTDEYSSLSSSFLNLL